MTLSNEHRALRDRIASALGLDPDDEIWCSTPGNAWQLRNRLWQGEPRSQRFPLALVFIDDATEAPTAVSNARERLAPKDNGFDAVAVVERGDDDHWRISKVLEPVGGTLGWRLKALSPAVEAIHVSPPNVELDRPHVGPRTASLVQEIVRQFDASPNVIIQGPPGTGKTYVALRVAEAMASGTDLAAIQFSSVLRKAGGDIRRLVREAWFLDLPLVWEVVQMHPGYSYDDFVRGRTLVSDAGGSRFESVDRIVPQMAATAAARGDRPTLLVIDEVNRCNLANVLGELIFALDVDKRGSYPIRLQYPPPPGFPPGEGSLLALPPSLKILATMNTADRSIALIDFAVRRRFRFIDLPPDPEVIAEHYAARPGAAARVRLLFEAVAAVVVEHLRVGHSYFLVPVDDEWPLHLANRFAYEVMPLLREYQQEGHLVGSLTIPLSPTCSIDIAAAPPVLDETVIRDSVRAFLES